MRSLAIARRVVAKEVLRQAFQDLSVVTDLEDATSVHGEFGLAENWPQVESWVRDWIAKHSQDIRVVIAQLCQQTYISAEQQEDLYRYICEELVDKIREIAASQAYSQAQLSERLANAGILPMFGFPTRVRLLYTRWSASEGTIDRPLDTAIAQFAPGSEIVKDRAVHTACGLVELVPHKRGVQSRPGLVPALDQPNRWLGLCRNCQAMIEDYQPQQTLSSPPPAASKLAEQTCPVCQQPTLRCIDAREPTGFFTNLQPRDFDGQFEWQPRASRPTLGVPELEAEAVTGNAHLQGGSGNVLIVNDRGGEGGFLLQAAQVFGKERAGAYVYSDVQGVNGSNDYIRSSEKAYRVALLAKRRTDVLLVSLQTWPRGVFANPTTLEGRAALYSFAFWLRAAACAFLDVDPDELQASFQTTVEGERVVGRAFLFDSLENGAGYCPHLAKPEVFSKLLQQENWSQPNSLASRWLQYQHQQTCDTSCNNCLRDYYNLAYHGLLDWRLALDMARLMQDAEAPLDLQSSWEGQKNPWQGLVERSLPPLLTNLGFQQVQDVPLPVWVGNRQREVRIVRHPLWTDEHPTWQKVFQQVQQAYPGANIQPINPFLTLRRPGDVLAKPTKTASSRRLATV